MPLESTCRRRSRPQLEVVPDPARLERAATDCGLGRTELTVYTSYRLHWFPYELIRCPTLVDSSVSTRTLYGNYKFRPPFPALSPRPTPASNLALTELDPGQWGATSADHCSVCARPIDEDLHQVWTSLRIATDVLALLVNACSDSCVQALPTPPNGHVSGPHGGGTLQQPKPMY